MTRSFVKHDCGSALIAVLLVMGGALFVATSLLFVAQADVAAGAGAAAAARSRAVAWSGVQAVMSRLNDQRSVILEGRVPRVEQQYVLYETASRLGIVRLLPLGPQGQRLVPEAGKLDLNHVNAEMLSSTGMIDELLAQAVIEYRDSQPGRAFQSVAELLRVPGVSAEALYGPLEELTVMDHAMVQDQLVTDRVSARLDSDSPRGLADVVTVYGFEPALQQNGRLRINLNVPWSEELGRRVEERFDREASEALQRIFQSGTTFETEARIFAVLRFFNVPPEDWPQIIDALTTDSDEFHFGRLDINTAPYEALVALPGLEPDQAAELVQVRDELPADERATIAWPVIQGIVESEAYDELAGRITTRCWTYRLRLAAGEVDADAPEGPLSRPVIYEAVIDLSAPRPRVAYLRDITVLQTTAILAVNASFDASESPEVTVRIDAGQPDDNLPLAEASFPEDGFSETPSVEADAVRFDEAPAMEAGDGVGDASRDDPDASTPSTSGRRQRRIGRWIGGG